MASASNGDPALQTDAEFHGKGTTFIIQLPLKLFQEIHMAKKILFVDDDPNILSGLQRMLRPMRDDWEMRFAASGVDALEMMQVQPADLIVADMRMPGMNGAELLAEVNLRYPGTIRIVLSGHADSELIMKSVSVAHQFLSKPCDAETLKLVIRKAIDQRAMLEDDRLKNVISRMGSLPSVPALYKELMAELQKPDISIDQVARVISRDPGMTAKILQLANSAFFGLRRSVSDAADAVAYLGLDHIQHLFLAVHAFMQFEPLKSGTFSIEQLWDHCMGIAVLAKSVMERQCSDKRMVKDAFTAGLLHDIGKLLLATKLPEAYSEILKETREKGTPVIALEWEEFSATHAEVGAYLLGLWGLPDAVVEATAFHHNPQMDTRPSVLNALHIAHARSKPPTRQ